MIHNQGKLCIIEVLSVVIENNSSQDLMFAVFVAVLCLVGLNMVDGMDLCLFNRRGYNRLRFVSNEGLYWSEW